MFRDKKNAIIMFLVVGLVICIAYIGVTNTILKSSLAQSSNAQSAKEWNKEERLPLGSIFTTADGTWMIIGQKPVSYVNDDFEVQSAESWTFDYYCVPYPEGCRSVYTEFESTALYNKSDIQDVLYVGKVDEQDEEYRTWIDNYDTSINNPDSETTKASGALYPQAPCVVEQNLRKQGKTTYEIYGNDFTSGELGTDLGNSGMLFNNYEWWNIMDKQGYTFDAAKKELNSQNNQ